MGVPLWNIMSPFGPLSSRTFDDCVTGATPSRVFDSLLGLILGRLVPCLGYYSSDSSFFFFKGEFTLLRKAPDISGSDSSAVISLCVFLQFFCNKIFLLILLVQGIIN